MVKPFLSWIVPDTGTALTPAGLSTLLLSRRASESDVVRSYAWLRYTAMGLFLALGAPAGALLLRMAQGSSGVLSELSAYRFFYLYTLIGTSIVFGASGFIAGLRADILARDRDHFHDLSEHDDLTGLLNSRAFWDRYRRAVEKANRYSEPLSLIFIDVDHLKDLNDRAGHRFGNRALLHVSEAILASKRGEDVAARWGGDEFGILMCGADADAASRVAADLLKKVSDAPVRTSSDERTVTVTIGIASAAAGINADGLFDRADQALFLGKARGGNRYQVFPEVSAL